MLSHSKQTFIKSLGKCLFLNEELCRVSPTANNLNPVELKYCPFMTNLVKYTGSCLISKNIFSLGSRRHKC